MTSSQPSYLRPTALFLAAAALSTAAAAQSYPIASTDTSGDPRRGGSPEISDDGRYVVFESDLADLVSGDTNAAYDVFRKDMTSGEVIRVSVASDGSEGDDDSRFPAISPTGRYIAFYSKATNLDSGDTNAYSDAFLHDTRLGTTKLVSWSTDGIAAGADYMDRRALAVSSDGSRVAFCSLKALDPRDTNARFDVYVRDLSTSGTFYPDTTLGGTRIGFSEGPDLSNDGSLLAFHTNVDMLPLEDPNGFLDVYLWDIDAGAYELCSKTPAGLASYGEDRYPEFGKDDRWLVFETKADDIDPTDTNTSFDVYLYDRTLGSVEVVSLDDSGAVSSLSGSIFTDRGAMLGSVSEDGRYICFDTTAGDLNDCDLPGVMRRDRTLGITELVAAGTYWTSYADWGDYPKMSADGSRIVFTNDSVPGGVLGSGKASVVRDMEGTGSIVLTGSTSAFTGSTVYYDICNAPASSPWGLYWSLTTAGTTVNGQAFDLGAPLRVAGTGTTDASGKGSFSTVIPPAGAGLTVYVEARCDSGGVTYDSNFIRLKIPY